MRAPSASALPAKIHARVAVALVVAAVAIACATLQAPAAHAQSAWNPRDDQYRALGLVRARAEYQRAATELERTRQLQAKHMASDAELEARRADATRTRVDYLQQALAVAGAAPHVMIVRAVKRRDDDGRPLVDVTLRSVAALSAEGASALDALAADVPELAGAARAGGGAHELFVSLKAAPGLDGATISSPYERHVRRLPASGIVTLSFRLMRDVDDVVVAVLSGDKVEERRVWLERGGGADRWRVTAAQESQDADLGAQVVYDLVVEHDGGDADAARGGGAARLRVTGLPPTVAYEFRDAATKARITGLGTRGTRSARSGTGGDAGAGDERRALQLVVSLPSAGDAAVVLDQPLRFTAWAAAEAEGSSLTSAAGGAATPNDSRPPAAGAVALEVIPRGVPRAELRTANLYVEMAGGDSAVVVGTVRNSGTRALRGVRLRVAPPDGWRVTQSAVLPALAVGAEAVMRATVLPPAGVEVGDYEARLKLEVASEAGRFQAEEKLMRIHVADAGASRSIALLGLAALLAAAGIWGAGRRLLRR